MKFKVNLEYQESYLPTPRCRKLRYREVERTGIVNIPEIKKSEAPVAFQVKESYSDDSYIDYLLNRCHLWVASKYRDYLCNAEGSLTIEGLREHLKHHRDYKKHENVEQALAGQQCHW